MEKDKILIIDDSEEIRYFLKSFLESNNYQTFEAENGTTGLAMIPQIEPDLIFLDFNMPDISGLELLEQITPLKNKPYNIIMISGYHDDELTKRCYDLGVYFFLTKPFNQDSLLSLTRQSINEKNYRLQYENIYNNLSEGLVYYNLRSKKILMVNKTFLDIFSLNENEVIGEDISDILIKKNFNEFCQETGLKLKKGVEVPYLKKDGSVVLTEVNASTVRLAHQDCIIILLRDITKKTLREKLLKEKDQVMLIQSRQAQMGELMSMITHQWRQPLTAINAATSMIDLMKKMDKYSEEKEEHLIKTIYSQVEYLSETIEDFRNFFMTDKKHNNVNASEIVKKAMTLVQNTLEKEDIKITINNDSEKMIEVYFNELVQVLINILMNAKDELIADEKDDKKIDITIVNDNDVVEIIIHNNGPLISEEIKGKIFDSKFTTKTEDKGTGLGLYMSRLIIEHNHNGKIYAENNDDGVSFIISLPAS